MADPLRNRAVRTPGKPVSPVVIAPALNGPAQLFSGSLSKRVFRGFGIRSPRESVHARARRQGPIA